MAIRKGHIWTPEEDALLRALYPNHTRTEIAAKMERTVGSIRSRCCNLGLNDKHRPEWTDTELALVRNWYLNAPVGVVRLDELARRLGRAKHTVCDKARELGLTDQRRRKVENRVHDQRKTSSAEELRKLQSENAKRMIRENGHPRGALGMKHTEETRKKISEASLRAAASTSKKARKARSAAAVKTKIEKYGTGGPVHVVGNPYSRCRGGRRADLGNTYFRSRWEANYARYLNLLVVQGQILCWEYEPQVFVFHGIIRGAHTYTPDFRITENDGTQLFHEVKGWMTSQARTRMKRMKKYYPEVKIVMIKQKEYTEIEKRVSAFIPNWER